MCIRDRIVCESIYKYNEFSYEECKLMLDSLEKDSKTGSEKDVKATLKYAEYALSLIHIFPRRNLHTYRKEVC